MQPDAFDHLLDTPPTPEKDVLPTVEGLDPVEFSNLLYEVDQKFVDDILAHGHSRDNRDLPFDNIFDNDPQKLRTAIPFISAGQKQVAAWLMNVDKGELPQLDLPPDEFKKQKGQRPTVSQDYAAVDLETGMIAKATNPDGSMKNPTRIGRVVVKKRKMERRSLSEPTRRSTSSLRRMGRSRETSRRTSLPAFAPMARFSGIAISRYRPR